MNIIAQRDTFYPIITCYAGTSPSVSKSVFAVHTDGVRTNGLQIKSDSPSNIVTKFEIDANGDITECRDITCREITATETVQCEDFEIRNVAIGDNVMVFRIFDVTGENVFSISNEGRIRTKWTEQKDILNAFGDDSLFIGSARYGYKRVSHEPTVEVLKQNYIPKYLSDLGVTLSNYSNYTSFDINNLTVKRWVKLAENFDGEDHYPSEVFPGAKIGRAHV